MKPNVKPGFKLPAAMKTPAERQIAEDNFINSAPVAPVAERVAAPAAPAKTEAASYPWIGLREGKETEVFNLRMTEVEKAKLDYVVTHSSGSRQKFVKEAFIAALDARIKELTSK